MNGGGGCTLCLPHITLDSSIVLPSQPQVVRMADYHPVWCASPHAEPSWRIQRTGAHCGMRGTHPCQDV